ncbi:MAG: hypothetical protein ABIR77_07430 [Sphingomicrobium sp.]
MTGGWSTRWWEKRWAVGAAMIAATIPLWLVRLAPQIDLLGHIGRYHLQLVAADNRLLAANWAVHWRWIGNLGGDLLMMILGPMFGVEAGARILSGLILMLMVSGMARLAIAAHGRLPATAWAAFPFAMAYPWHYGLVNYWLGIALALHAAASFWRRAASGRTVAAIGIASLLLWTVHIFGWAVFATIMAARRLTSAGYRERRASLVLLAALATPVVVMAVQRYGADGHAAATLGWFRLGYKLSALSWTLRDQNQGFDLACLGSALLLIAAGNVSAAFARDRALLLAAFLLAAFVVLLPYQLFGSAFADGRLWPVALILALLAIAPRERHARLDAGIALVAGLLFLLRIGMTAIGFVAYDAAYTHHLKALDLVPRGSRIAVLVDFQCKPPWRRERLEHLDGIAIVRRDAFTNGQWEVPGAQLVAPLGARGTPFNSDPSELSFNCGDPIGALGRRLATLPRDRFDYVWLLAYPPASLPPMRGLSPMFADDRTILYRIDR